MRQKSGHFFHLLLSDLCLLAEIRGWREKATWITGLKAEFCLLRKIRGWSHSKTKETSAPTRKENFEMKRKAREPRKAEKKETSSLSSLPGKERKENRDSSFLFSFISFSMPGRGEAFLFKIERRGVWLCPGFLVGIWGRGRGRQDSLKRGRAQGTEVF